jgi:hypothetical protein
MQAGSLVICVNTQGLTPDMPFNRLPVLGETYIVREMVPDIDGPPPLHPEGVALEGIIGGRALVQTWQGPRRVEYHFHAWRFRELLSPEELALLEEVEETAEVPILR